MKIWKKYHRTTITIPQETYQKLKILAALQNKSVSAFIRDLIQETISVNKKNRNFPFWKIWVRSKRYCPRKKFIKLISGKRYLLDTNVLIYSVDKASPFYAKAKKVIEIGIKQNVSFVITHQNLLEYTAVLRRVYKRITFRNKS